MKQSEGAEYMAELAKCERKIAHLHAELANATARRSELYLALAGDRPVDLRTGRAIATRHVPNIPEPSDVDRARARQVLKQRGIRRKTET